MLLTVAGLQIPLIPFIEGDCKLGANAFSHIGAIAVKVGVIVFITVVIVIGVAHRPESGVKVYVPGVVLFKIAGLQLPLIPLFEVLGKAGTVES